MCGIAGYLSLSGQPADERVLLPMLAAQRHRGPDDEGTWAEGPCALGHRRLSVIDLSAAAHQPMRLDNLVITYNGEIYNYRELRSELEQRGCRFRSQSDTEVILQAYRQWGEDCLHRLRGMFAFAIWDGRKLFLARDRVGKKPLFYARDDKRFIFASELQGLLAAGIDRTLSPHAIDLFLTWGYIPAPYSAFAHIHKLPAGCWMMADGEPRRFWSLAYEPKLDISEAEACERLRDKVREAVRMRLISDVPLGAWLSGGIDSSIVVALMAQESGRAVKTFSIGFEEAAFDELEYAREVAHRFGTEHQEFVVRADADILPQLARHYGEPFGDDSAVPTYYLARETRGGVTVALSGDGGDESFAGYERYLASGLSESLSHLPGNGTAADLLQSVAGWLPRKARRFVEAIGQPLAFRYGRWVGTTVGQLSRVRKDDLYRGPLQEARATGQAWSWFCSLFDVRLATLDQVMSVDVHSYLPYDLLVKTDISSMAVGLETRCPLLDHEVMELAAHLPVSFKQHRWQSKYLLKKAFHDLLPPRNARRSKMGFGLPVSDWLRGGLRGLLRDTLTSPHLEWIDPAALRSLIEEHLDERADHALQLWNLMNLEIWYREVVERGIKIA